MASRAEKRSSISGAGAGGGGPTEAETEEKDTLLAQMRGIFGKVCSGPSPLCSPPPSVSSPPPHAHTHPRTQDLDVVHPNNHAANNLISGMESVSGYAGWGWGVGWLGGGA